MLNLVKVTFYLVRGMGDENKHKNVCTLLNRASSLTKHIGVLSLPFVMLSLIGNCFILSLVAETSIIGVSGDVVVGVVEELLICLGGGTVLYLGTDSERNRILSTIQTVDLSINSLKNNYGCIILC